MSEYDVQNMDLLPVPRNGESHAGQGHYNYYNDPASSGKQQVEQIIDTLFRRKWIIISSFLIIFGLAYWYSVTRTPEYQTSGFVMVNLGRVTVDLSRMPSSEIGSDDGFEVFARNDRSLSGEIRLLEISDQLLQRVHLRLQNSEIAEIPRSELRNRIRFSPESGTKNIIRFTGKSSNAEQAAMITNLYTQEYVRLTQEASRTHVLALRESLEEKEEEQRKEVEQLEERIKRLNRSGAVDLDTEATRLVTQIAALELQYDDSQVEYEVEQAALTSLEQELDEINPQLAQRIASGIDRRIEALQEELEKIENVRSQFLIEYPELRDGRTNALKKYDDDIESLRNEIDSLSFQYVSEVASSGGISGSSDGLVYVANLRQQIADKRVTVNRIKARLDVLNERLSNYQTSVQRLPRQSMEMAQLERSRIRVERMYQNTVSELQKAYIAEESEPGYAQIVQKAKIPASTGNTNTQRNLILGSFFGLLLGLGLAVVRDKLDYRIYQADELRSVGLKEIGVIPNMKPLIKKEFKGEEFHEIDDQKFSTSLIPFLNPISAAAEAYRYIRTYLGFRLSAKSTQVLMVTSPGMSEGKSTTAANLAIVLAQAGKNTLLIDADLRRPKLHKLFDRSRGAGLIELLASSSLGTALPSEEHDEIPEEQARSSKENDRSQEANEQPSEEQSLEKQGESVGEFKTWKTKIDKLSLLTAGSPKSHLNGGDSKSDLPVPAHALLNPSELLGSNQMREFMDSMRTKYDVIVLDTPPVLAASDALLLSGLSDAVLLVVRSGVTKEGELDTALEALDDVGANILGAILNGFDIGNAYGHKYKYQHYTKYGHYSDYAE